VRLGLVVPLYGPEADGGAEGPARGLAERLGARHAVEVLTTTAIEDRTWRNTLPPGLSEANRVAVRRFPVARERDPERAELLAARLSSAGPTGEDERRWVEEQGPVAPSLVAHLRAHGSERDALAFFGWRSWTTVNGLPAAPSRSLLVLLAEGDPFLRPPLLRQVLARPAAAAWSSPEEREDVRRAAGAVETPGDVIGTGLDLPADVPPGGAPSRLGLHGDYVVCAGGGREPEGCAAVVDRFLAWQRRTGRDVTLAVLGGGALPLAETVHVRRMGTVSAEDRRAVIANARAVLAPSRDERPVLEAWREGRPVLVNGDDAARGGQVVRAGGGLFYQGPVELGAALEALLDQPALADALGRQGRAHVAEHHAWDRVVGKYERLLESVAAGTAS